jgi:hypothetical protein
MEHETRGPAPDECIFTATPSGGILGVQKLIRLTLLFRTQTRTHIYIHTHTKQTAALGVI